MKMESWGLCSCSLPELLQVTNIWNARACGHPNTSHIFLSKKHVLVSSSCVLSRSVQSHSMLTVFNITLNSYIRLKPCVMLQHGCQTVHVESASLCLIKCLPRCTGGLTGDPCWCHQDQAPGVGSSRPDDIQRSHRLLQEDPQGGRFQGILEGHRR